MSLTLVVAVRVPEVPVMATVAAPVVAVLLAVSVSTLVLAVGLVAKAAVTPLGSPAAASDTLPVNPPAPTTEMLLFPLLPWVIDKLDGDAERVKLGGTVTLSLTVADAFRLPEVPLMVTVAAPVVAVLLAVSVSRLEFVAGLVAKAAVTPPGRPAAARVTPPANPPTPVTEMALVPLLP